MKHDFLKTFGFDSANDFINNTLPMGYMKGILVLSIFAPAVERVLGMPLDLLIFFVLGLILEALMGIIAAVWYTEEGFRTAKFGRFFVKVLVFFGSISVVNFLKLGFEKLQIKQPHINSFIDYSLDAFYAFFVFMIGAYLLLSIIENGAKMQIPGFKEAAKFLKIKIKQFNENQN